MRHNYLSADLAGEIGGQNRHVVLFGQVGSGKTSIFNLLVSHRKDIKRSGKEKYGPIVGSCRLGHIGEVTLIDTAGLNDVSELDGENATSVRNTVRRADIAIYVINIQEFDETARQTYQHAHDWLVKNDVPYLQVFNRCDEAYAGDIAKLKMEFPDAIFISANTSGSISLLRARLSQMFRTSEDIEGSLVPDNLVCEGDYVLLLVPESGLIHEYLIMMDLINRGARCVIIHEDDLENALKEIPRVDLVIAYARSFGKVRDIVPENVPLTSYSLLYAKQRGVLEDFIAGARTLGDLKENSRILVAVGSRASEVYKEIGRIKIPRSLRRVVGEELQIDYNFGLDLPEDLSSYDLVIHDTGATMSTRSVQARVAICREAGVPSANYGTVLAALAGVLDRCEAVLLPKE